MTVGRKKQYELDVRNLTTISGYVGANSTKMEHEEATYEWQTPKHDPCFP